MGDFTQSLPRIFPVDFKSDFDRITEFWSSVVVGESVAVPHFPAVAVLIRRWLLTARWRQHLDRPSGIRRLVPLVSARQCPQCWHGARAISRAGTESGRPRCSLRDARSAYAWSEQEPSTVGASTWVEERRAIWHVLRGAGLRHVGRADS